MRETGKSKVAWQDGHARNKKIKSRMAALISLVKNVLDRGSGFDTILK